MERDPDYPTGETNFLPTSPVAVGAAGRRVGWVVADQAVSSLTNFALSLIILREVGQKSFGAFAVAMTTYFVALGVSRALSSDPLVVLYSDVSYSAWRKAIVSSTGLSVALGGAIAIILLVASSVVDPLVAQALRPLALSLPGLLLQDAWRYAFFSGGRPRQAFVNDVCWGVAQIMFVGWAVSRGKPSVGLVVMTWGAAALVAAVVGIAQSRTVPHPGQSYVWISTHKALGPRFAAEFLLDRATSQAMVLIVGGISGLAAVGALTAAPVILGPFRVVALGASGFAVPEAARLWRRSPGALLPTTLGLGLALFVLAVACGGAATLLPDAAGRQLLGATWSSARAVLPGTTLWIAALGFAEGARVGLRVLAASRQSLRAQASAAPLVMLGGVVGAVVGDAPGAATGLAIACCLQAAIWWRYFTVTLRSARHAATASPR